MTQANDAPGLPQIGAYLPVILLCVALSCTTVPRPGLQQDERALADAESLYARIQRDTVEGDFARAVDGARKIISNYPDFHRSDEVHLLAAKSLRTLGRCDDAVKFVLQIPEKYPTSSYWEEALLLASLCFVELRSYSRSADALLQVITAPTDADIRSQAIEALRRLIRDHLRPQDLEALADKYPSSPLAEELSLTIAKNEFARGNYDKAFELLTELLYHFPESKYSMEARRLLKLSAEARSKPGDRPGYVNPFNIGVVLPITGPYSLYGRYFEQGLLLALEEYNQAHEFQVTIAKADSKGNPVDAVKAVRKLAIEEGVVALIGPVFTVPTIAASIEANARHVALLSPIVFTGRITEVGPWIFHTKVPDEVEVTAMAQAAKEGLLIKRFAVLAPDFGERRRLSDFFSEEIKRLGGEVVAEAHYDEGETNFKDQLESIRDAAPEALFIPGSTEELILILPQINFYDVHARLLGLSNWNSEKLIRLSEQEIENALFPLDAYHGKDKAAYEHFIAAYEEQFGGELSPVTVSGYFGMRLLLRSLAEGAADRTQVKDFLYNELFQDAGSRMSEAAALSIMTVRSGRVRKYEPLQPREP
ncbi:MAG: ABC transporter substrate-binding protein [Candidatus Latescibacteria bacterium]|nr:ABC transporter substrate-binding protein [Candidatus Latescibacterota bacterium]NIM21114.1 ABC transporter substrate-binding protein [Candidatus Latescibacterota bacterium]NIM65249.1 ABC transporter substrate-binding protein [Candidatus Latescibacterota bacterium]NIO01764.1 ABC transporter substrate-binding protein [Candidatus Latescibacterota bacterium]NIO28281.1 ABC transporter substrate-binding protein [Candidatus Latescibacterota bacterium]